MLGLFELGIVEGVMAAPERTADALRKTRNRVVFPVLDLLVGSGRRSSGATCGLSALALELFLLRKAVRNHSEGDRNQKSILEGKVFAD